MRQVSLIGIASVMATLGACSSGPMLGEQSTAVSVAPSLPPPDPAGMATDVSNYQIGPLDVIRVETFGAAELTREGEVDAAGNFSMPLVGTISAAGKTPAQLAAAISAQLQGRYLRNPQVSVNVVKAQSKTFTVDGAVRQPGVYPIVGKITLQQAIATARGTDQAANLNNVVVFRTVNARKMAALFSLKEIRAGRLDDPQVYPNDIVVVGESAFRRFFRDFAGTFPLLGQFVPVL